MSYTENQIVYYRNIELTDVVSLGKNININTTDEITRCIEMPSLGDVMKSTLAPTTLAIFAS